MPVIACKLPHGLDIRHKGLSLKLRGANSGENLAMPSANGMATDNAFRSAGFGLTEVNGSALELFTDWQNAGLYTGGQKTNGKLAEPFAALVNGSIMGPFKTIDEARLEVLGISDAIVTGAEGLDAEEEAKKPGGVQPDDKEK